MSNDPGQQLCYSPDGICSYYTLEEGQNCSSLGWDSESCYPVDSVRTTPNGSSGTAGTAGSSGTSGNNGTSNSSGTSGTAGSSGSSGSSGNFSSQLVSQFVWEFEQDPEPVTYRRYTDDVIPTYRVILKNLSTNLTMDAYVVPTTPPLLQVIDVNANKQITNLVPIRLSPLEEKIVRVQFDTANINLVGVQTPQLQFRLDGFLSFVSTGTAGTAGTSNNPSQICATEGNILTSFTPQCCAGLTPVRDAFLGLEVCRRL